MTEEQLTDEEYLKDLYGNLHDLVECCMESKLRRSFKELFENFELLDREENFIPFGVLVGF